MASASAGDLGRQLNRLFGSGSAVGLTDGELIDDSPTAEVSRRKPPSRRSWPAMGVWCWTVCRQVLGDAHAAEDAFQATFLVLVRRAGTLQVREPGSLGPWLYGVAYRIALKARQGAARRGKRERAVARPAVAGRPPRRSRRASSGHRFTTRSTDSRRSTVPRSCSATSRAGRTTRPPPR